MYVHVYVQVYYNTRLQYPSTRVRTRVRTHVEVWYIAIRTYTIHYLVLFYSAIIAIWNIACYLRIYIEYYCKYCNVYVYTCTVYRQCYVLEYHACIATCYNTLACYRCRCSSTGSMACPRQGTTGARFSNVAVMAGHLQNCNISIVNTTGRTGTMWQ